MSELGKKIGKVLRRETSGGIGFGAVKREQPRAMLLAARAKDATAGKAAVEAGADLVLLEGLEVKAAAAALKSLEKVTTGVQLPALDEAGAAALKEAGCDFVISPLASTASAAVDTEAMGQVVALDGEISDTTLRALAPLGLDALFVAIRSTGTTLADQLELVRIASLSGAPLAVSIDPGAGVGELRVLRDAGAAIAVIPAGTPAVGIAGLVETLKAVPAPKKGARGGDIALVPSMARKAEEAEEEPEDE